MRRIEVTATTMGQSSPSHVAEGKYYKFKGDPSWTPNDPRYREPPRNGKPDGGPGSSERKQQRMERFEAALRDLGYTPQSIPPAPPKVVREAGKQADVGYDTARVYLNELKQRSLQDGGVRDA